MTIQQMSNLVHLLVRHTAYLNLMLKGLDLRKVLYTIHILQQSGRHRTCGPMCNTPYLNSHLANVTVLVKESVNTHVLDKLLALLYFSCTMAYRQRYMYHNGANQQARWELRYSVLPALRLSMLQRLYILISGTSFHLCRLSCR